MQVGFSVEALLRWAEREQPPDPGVRWGYCPASSAMARTLAETIPDIEIPEQLVERIDRDPNAGIEAACDLLLAIRDTRSFSGVHLIPVSCYRPVAARSSSSRGSSCAGTRKSFMRSRRSSARYARCSGRILLAQRRRLSRSFGSRMFHVEQCPPNRRCDDRPRGRRPERSGRDSRTREPASTIGRELPVRRSGPVTEAGQPSARPAQAVTQGHRSGEPEGRRRQDDDDRQPRCRAR